MCFFHRNSPDVIVDFVFDKGLLFVTVRNIGNAPAHKVSVKFEQEIKGLAGTKLNNDMPLFHHLEFLPPGKEIVTFLDTSASYFAAKQPTQIELLCTFHDRHGRPYRRRIKHNLEIYRDIGYVQR